MYSSKFHGGRWDKHVIKLLLLSRLSRALFISHVSIVRIVTKIILLM